MSDRNNTGNPVESTSFLDGEDNLKALDSVVNSPEETTVDRFGNPIKTLAGLAVLASGIPAVLASAEAQAARDAAIVNAPIYPDEPTGRAAVADNEYFNVVGSATVAASLYKRLSSSASQLIVEYPSVEAVKDVARSSAEWNYEIPVTFEAGSYYNYSTGAKVTSASYKSVKFAVTGQELGIRVTGKTQGATTALAIYYDENNVYIGYEQQGGTLQSYVDFELTVPARARYIAFSCPKTQANAVFDELRPISLIDRLTDVENKLAIWDDPDFTLTYESGSYYVYSNGAKVTLASYKSAKVPITGDELAIRITAKVQGGSTAVAIYYDASNVYIGYQNVGISTVVSYDKFELTVPANARYIAVSCPISQPDAVFEVLRASDLAEVNESVKAVSDQLSGDNYITHWTGKKIVWFGTSIPAGSGTNSYPYKIADYIGATVVNEAVGGSAARNGVSANATGGDPYGWTGMAYAMAAYSLSMSLAEKNYLIDNYSTFEPLFAEGTAPASLDSTEIAKILGSSWENKLTRHLGVDAADLYVFDHGHNDNSFDTITDAPATEYDRGTFRGAMDFLINKILEDNPRARICFIGHYENDRKPDITAAQELVAEKWDFPFFRLWQKLGWTQNTVTYGGEEKTITEIWMPDDLHPHSDTTGAATTLIARTIIPFLRDVSP